MLWISGKREPDLSCLSKLYFIVHSVAAEVTIYSRTKIDVA